MIRGRIALAMVVLVAAVAGCSGGSPDRARGDGELAAIKLPADWRLSSSQFVGKGMNESTNRWDRWYDTPVSAPDALAAYDSAARAAGWRPGDGCPLSSGHGCWVKLRYTLTASPSEGSGCHPGDKICAIVDVTMTDDRPGP